MNISKAMIAEFSHEAASTRRLLERVPDDRLDFKPHEKSMPLGRLAGHLAEMPQWAESVVGQAELVMGTGDYEPVISRSCAETLDAFDVNVAKFKTAVDGTSDEAMMEPWTLRFREQTVMTVPRASALRTFVLNHLIHHRGQLSVYLRLLDVALPQVYGPTADDTGAFG